MKKLLNIAGSLVGVGLMVILAVMLISSLRAAQPNETQVGPAQSPPATPIADVELTPVLIVETEPVEAVFQSPLQPTPTTEKPVTSTPEIIRPPLCKFNGVKEEIKQPESLIDRYVFSEPNVILSHDGAIQISQWLPDNQRILISKREPGTVFETIEVVNTTNGETKVYGKGKLSSNVPPSHRFVWIPVTESVSYVTIEPDKYVLHISNGEKASEIIAADLASLYLASPPNGEEVSFSARDNLAQPYVYNVAKKDAQPVMPGSKSVQPGPDGYIDFWQQYQITWRPDGKQYARFNNQAFYLTDATTGDTCEVDLGKSVEYGKRWALFAEWSPNGRYLALLSTAGEPIFPFVDLLILDTANGNIHKFDIKGGSRVVYAISWGPNSRDLLMIVPNTTNTNEHQLYLVDVITTEQRIIKSETPLIGVGYWGIDWTTDGKHIALSCPTLVETEEVINTGHLCIIDVEVK